MRWDLVSDDHEEWSYMRRLYSTRRALRALIADGIVFLVHARITAPGNGLRRLVALIDGRSIRAGRSAAPEHTERDQRCLVAPRDVRRLAALKDD